MRCFWLRCARPAVARLMLPTVRLVSNGPGEISEGAGGFAPPSSVMDDKQWAMTSMLLLPHKNGLEVAGVLAEWSRRVASAACSARRTWATVWRRERVVHGECWECYGGWLGINDR